MGVLENIVKEVKEHDKDHPDHGLGCACMDKHSTAIRRLLYQKDIVLGDKSLGNIKRILGYICKS